MYNSNIPTLYDRKYVAHSAMAQVDHKSCYQFLKSLNVPDVIKKKCEAKVHSRQFVQKPISEPPQEGDAEGYVNAGAFGVIREPYHSIRQY